MDHPKVEGGNDMRNPPANLIRRIGVTAALAPYAFSIAGAQTIGNPDVYAAASLVADEIELVREVMGRPFDDSPRLPASDASQLEVYFQAQTLFRKANQLAQEYAGAARVAAPPLPDTELQAADTHAVVTGALEQIRMVKDALEIDAEVETALRSPASATGVFMTILDANRQLNLLINNPILSHDVFDQVTLAVVYSAAILSLHGISDVVPDAPAFDGHKRSADVYALLLRSTAVLSRIAEKSDVHVLKLSSRRNIPDDIEPGHVYDIARILVAGLAVLSDALGTEDVFPTLERPELIFPTQVHARASVLLLQLEQIDAGL